MHGPAPFTKAKFYGAAAVSEKGQVVIPAELRKRFDINTGDRLLVVALEKRDTWAIIFTKSEVISKMVSQLVQSMFGAELDEILQAAENEGRLSEEPHQKSE